LVDVRLCRERERRWRCQLLERRGGRWGGLPPRQGEAGRL
jgi:hypothetical protein